MFFTVKTQENVVVERFGKFKKVARPGLNTKVPFIETTSKPVSLRVQQLEVNIESKTKDNVFVTVPVAVQYVVEEDNVADAYYKSGELRGADPLLRLRHGPLGSVGTDPGHRVRVEGRHRGERRAPSVRVDEALRLQDREHSGHGHHPGSAGARIDELDQRRPA
jgi:hypothetical protein